MGNQKTGTRFRWGRFIWRLILFCFFSSLLYVFLCKWVMPPITVTQLSDAIGGNGLKRDYISWEEIPANVKLAAIASEDQLFPEHNGFDWDAIEKSIEASKKDSTKVAFAGTSTISQQVAKNVFLWQGEGVTKYIRKIPEVYFTKLIEWIWGKKRILEVYLNVIEMGKGIYGIEAASQAYFHVNAAKLTRTQAAQIIACLPNPKLYTVKPMSRYVSWKSRWILKQMNNISDDPAIRAVIQ